MSSLESCYINIQVYEKKYSPTRKVFWFSLMQVLACCTEYSDLILGYLTFKTRNKPIDESGNALNDGQSKNTDPHGFTQDCFFFLLKKQELSVLSKS